MSVVGIDLGTTNSAVASLWMGRPEIIPNRYGGRTTPSVVAVSQNCKILVGHKAKYQRVTLIAPPLEEIKRKMGKEIAIELAGHCYSPQQISSFILRCLKIDSEEFLKQRVDRAVITIPAYFDESARRATRKAGELAGLDVAMILDEPTAAALAYGLDGNREEVIAVYDLGGGTFDVSIIEIDGNHFEVLAIDGDTHLGGKDFDNILYDYVEKELQRCYRYNIDDPKMTYRLSVSVEAVKCDLSRQMDSTVIVEGLCDKLDVNIDIKRELLEELTRPLIESTLLPLERALQKADLEVDEIDHVILVGGATRMPLVRETVAGYFHKKPLCSLNPDECVAMGAALYSRLLGSSGKQYSLPSECDIDARMVVVPRTAHALGIGVDEGGNALSVILPAGSFYPVSITRKDYYTAIADQDGIEFWVYEGENPLAQKNNPLGLVRLGLPKGLPAGIPIWVTFGLNVSRILEVTVQLPDRPQAKVSVKIEAQGESSAKKTATTSLEHQVKSIRQLLIANEQQLSQTRRVEISWALSKVQQALEKGKFEIAQQKMHLLEHIRDELIALEKKDF